MANLMWILLSTFLLLRTLEAYKALVLVPLPSKSHSILGNKLVELIADAGNEVTYVTSYPREKPPPRVREISIDTNKKMWTDGLNLTGLLNGKASAKDIKGFTKIVTSINLQTLQTKDVQLLMNSPNEQFDVVIADWMYGDIYAGLAAIFDCPLIWLSTMPPNWELIKLVDTLPNPAYTSDVSSLYQPPSTFIHRVQELGYRIYMLFLEYFFRTKIQNTQYENVIAPCIRRRGKAVPDFEELRFNASLVLANTHISLANPTSLPENYKPIAGYHISKDTKPLTGELKKILDDAKHGVIYFSLGSNLKSESMPIELKNNLLKMFAQLKQTILWTFEENIPHKPANVHIIQWAPQSSILAHQNCVLFITHGGFLSMIEAVHFGKPLIGIPIYGDQIGNIVRAVQKGFALKVELSYGMADKLQEAIQEILNTPRYADKAKELSFIYFHRTASPATELLHWVEHVVRTRGALHLRSPALKLSWFQKMYLDLIVVILGSILGLKMLISRVYVTLFKKQESKEKKN